MSVDLNPHYHTNMYFVFYQLPAAKIFRRRSEGAAEGGCGGNSAAPERLSPAACSVRSRSQQKSFLSLFLLEEKIGRAQIKKCRENFFAGWRALASSGGANQLPFRSKNVRTSFKKHRQESHFEKSRLEASAQSASAWYFSAILKAFLKSKTKVRSVMRKFAERSSGKMKFCKPIFFLSSASGRTKG